MEVESDLRIHFTTDSKLPSESELKQKIESALENALHTLMYDLDIVDVGVHCFFMDDFEIREEDD